MRNVVEVELEGGALPGLVLVDGGGLLRCVARTGVVEEHRWYTLEEQVVEYRGRLWSVMAPGRLDEGCRSEWRDVFGSSVVLTEVEPYEAMATRYRAVDVPEVAGPFELLRPSSLPKLAACRMYRGKPGSSPAAERGTRMDAAIRKAVSAGVSVDPADLDCEDADIAACNWAIDQLKELAMGMHVETDEARLRVGCPVSGVAVGTMDACCPEGGWLADFKTGQIRDYELQMAAYSLGCMVQYGVQEWSAHLIFVDQGQVVSRRFTHDEALRLVGDVVCAERVPHACEYCGWCVNCDCCPAHRAAVLETVGVAAELPAGKPGDAWPAALSAMVTEPAKAHRFLSLLSVAEAWGKKLRDEIRGQEAPDKRYFTRVTVSGTRKVKTGELAPYLERLDVAKLLGVCGTIPLADFEPLWREAYGEEPIPEVLIGSFGGSTQLRLKKVKEPAGAIKEGGAA